jgi:hypothetical protein
VLWDETENPLLCVRSHFSMHPEDRGQI